MIRIEAAILETAKLFCIYIYYVPSELDIEHVFLFLSMCLRDIDG